MIHLVVTGAHSTGKTTLVDELTRSLQAQGIRCRKAEEPIRQHWEELQSLDRFSRYLRLVAIHFQRLDNTGAACCIYDRSLLDLLVHYRLEEPANPHFEAMILEILKWYGSIIDAFIYLPVEIPLEADERRPKAEKYRQQVDRAIKTSAGEAGIRLHGITGSVAERTQQVLQLFQQIRASKTGNSHPEFRVNI